MHSLNSFHITRHAQARANQRGIDGTRLNLLLSHADIIVPVDRNMCASRLSRQAQSEALQAGFSPADVERSGRFAVVEADDGAIVTVAAVHGPKARHYKRRTRRYWKDGK